MSISIFVSDTRSLPVEGNFNKICDFDTKLFREVYYAYQGVYVNLTGKFFEAASRSFCNALCLILDVTVATSEKSKLNYTKESLLNSLV
jgi:hypothetical protein